MKINPTPNYTRERLRKAMTSFIKRVNENTQPAYFIGSVTEYTKGDNLVVKLINIPEDIEVSWNEGLLYILKDQDFKVGDSVVMVSVEDRFLILGTVVDNFASVEYISADKSHKGGKAASGGLSTTATITGDIYETSWALGSSSNGFSIPNRASLVIPTYIENANGILLESLVGTNVIQVLSYSWGESDSRTIYFDIANDKKVRVVISQESNDSGFRVTFKESSANIPSSSSVNVYLWV